MANPKPFLKKMLKIRAGKKKPSAPIIDGYQTQTTPAMERTRKLRTVLKNNPYPKQ
tara:strand:+ start:464 stop:631 length:168 start_codon:yes stop_codon:yes gene_type:complete